MYYIPINIYHIIQVIPTINICHNLNYTNRLLRSFTTDLIDDEDNNDDVSKIRICHFASQSPFVGHVAKK